MKLENVKSLFLDMENKADAEKWLQFSWENAFINETSEISNLKKDIIRPRTRTLKITAEFSIPNSLIIRHYSSNPSESDSVHLKCNGKSVVSGTSWAGVIRHTLADLGESLGKSKEICRMLEKMFGYVDKNKNISERKKPQASRFIIEESLLSGGEIFPVTRNRIDRFTGGASEGALFTEEPYFGGTVSLNILCPHDIKDHEIGLILLAIREIGNGISPVGGESAVGRGILEGRAVKIDNSEIDYNGEKYSSYMKALANEIRKENQDDKQ